MYELYVFDFYIYNSAALIASISTIRLYHNLVSMFKLSNLSSSSTSAVIGLTPDQGFGSEAFDAFLDIVEKQLMPLAIDLEATINERFEQTFEITSFYERSRTIPLSSPRHARIR